MTYVVDASVVLRWFVDQPGSEVAAAWLERLVENPDLLVAPDLLRFEIHGGLARLQGSRKDAWAADSFKRFDALGLRTLPTTLPLFERALTLS